MYQAKLIVQAGELGYQCLRLPSQPPAAQVLVEPDQA